MLFESLLTHTPAGLYCPKGDFYIDPTRAVPRAVITHAHSDHARPGSAHYLCARPGLDVLRGRIGANSNIETVEYGETRFLNQVKISLHPAGHIHGSAQVRVEYQGEIWVATGDYKTTPDPTCTPFELVRCHTFITECTFGLPLYRWPDERGVFAEINQWWRANQKEGRASVLFGYSLGKAQRLLAGVDASLGPIYCPRSVQSVNDQYRASGVALPETFSTDGPVSVANPPLIVAPMSEQNTGWLDHFGDWTGAFASGWMLVRRMRRQRGSQRGFVLSDHVDWQELLDTIKATGAELVLPYHGYVGAVVRWLRDQGLQADALES